MANIKLTQNQEAIVDDSDFEWLNSFKWMARKSKNTWYAARKGEGGVVIYMHRLLLDFPSERVDHINGNGLDNRKDNIRIATRAQNAQNKPAYSKSGFKGVYYLKNGKFIASIQVDQIQKYLGTFTDPIEAAHRYDGAALFYFGEKARLNFG